MINGGAARYRGAPFAWDPAEQQCLEAVNVTPIDLPSDRPPTLAIREERAESFAFIGNDRYRNF